tara:strand:+ start:261 stop:2420 length:2160 start_codon:yes stop_codon:yes gene_type:complete
MAGFWAGFGEQLSENIEQRKKTLDRLIEENLENARVAKGKYTKNKQVANTVLKSAESIRDRYGLSKGQTLALAEAYGADLPRLEATLDANNNKLKANVGIGYDATDVMAFVNMSGDLEFPEDANIAEGVERLMGLHYNEAAKESNPKSESAKTRSFIRAAMAFDPQMQAMERMESIKGPGGMNYAQLLELEAAGFAPEDIYGGVTRGAGPTYDYTEATGRTTNNFFSRELSQKIFQSDLNNPTDYMNYNASQGKDKALLKAKINNGGTAMQRLEKEIVLAFRGTDMGLDSFRKGVLQDIYDSIETEQQLDSFIKSVNSQAALDIIKAKNGQLSPEDIQGIIAGSRIDPEAEKKDAPITVTSDNLEETTVVQDDADAMEDLGVTKTTTVDDQDSMEEIGVTKTKVEPPTVTTDKGEAPAVLTSIDDLQLRDTYFDAPDSIKEQINNLDPTIKTDVDVARMLLLQNQKSMKERTPFIDAAVDKINMLKNAEGLSEDQKAAETLKVLVQEANITIPTNETEMGYFKDDLKEAIEDHGLDISPSVEQAIIKRASKFDLASMQLPDDAPTLSEQLPELNAAGFVAGNAGQVALRNIKAADSLRDSMANYTRAEWNEMSRKERKEKGLPENRLNLYFAGSDAFKAPEKQAPEDTKIQTSQDFIEQEFRSVIEYLEEEEVDYEDREDIKSGIAAWFADNDARLDISSSLTTDEITDGLMQVLQEQG